MTVAIPRRTFLAALGLALTAPAVAVIAAPSPSPEWIARNLLDVCARYGVPVEIWWGNSVYILRDRDDARHVEGWAAIDAALAHTVALRGKANWPKRLRYIAALKANGAGRGPQGVVIGTTNASQ